MTELADGIIISPDGKTVTGFNKGKSRGKAVIHIPSGVERIDDYAFFGVKIDSLYIPKELEYLGKYTLRDEDFLEGYFEGPYCLFVKKVRKIEVEEGSRHFFCDGRALYSAYNGGKRLEYVIDDKITEYAAPCDLKCIPHPSLANCFDLERVILTEGFEEFDECALEPCSIVKEVFLPKSVKNLRIKKMEGGVEGWNTVCYRVDEKNEKFFTDGDSLYEVLEDGTYKLLKNQYFGKGETEIPEGVSIIGERAFE